MKDRKKIEDVNKAASILGRLSAEARIRKWGKKEFVNKLRAWGKKGGRPKGSGKKQRPSASSELRAAKAAQRKGR